MKKLILFSIFLLSIFLFSSVSLSQITLTPGNTTIYITSIELEVDEHNNSLFLYGSQFYLNVKWNARYSDNIERPIGVICYLNCPNVDQINNETTLVDVCSGYENCSYEGITGEHYCTFKKPNYIYTRTENNSVYCEFYYPPLEQNISFIPYPNRTFKPIDFSLSYPNPINSQIGKTTTFQISIKNNGIFKDSYLVNISTDYPNYLEINKGILSSKEIEEYETTFVYPSFTPLVNPLSGISLNISVLPNSSSNISSLSCTSTNDCSWLSLNPTSPTDVECINGLCYYIEKTTVSSKYKSMSEFPSFLIFEILIISILIYFFFERKKLKKKLNK